MRGFGTGGRELGLLRAELDEVCRLYPPSAGGRMVVADGPKGQSGKTTAVSVLGKLVSPRVAGVSIGWDMNPDMGTLVTRSGGRAHPSTMRAVDLAENAAEIRYPSELNVYLDAVERFHLLHNDNVPPKRIRDITPEQYAQMLKTLRQFAALTLLDAGTSLIHPSMEAALVASDHLVMACRADPSAMNLAVKGAALLRADGFEDLVTKATVVITVDDSSARIADFVGGIQFFEKLCPEGHVQVVEYDRAAGAVGAIDWANLKTRTEIAYTKVALSVAKAVFEPPTAAALPYSDELWHQQQQQRGPGAF